MKGKRSIFILLVIGLVACVAKLVNVTSDCADAICFNQYEIEISSVSDSKSSVSCDNTFDKPISAAIFASGNHVHTGQVRTVNRCKRLMCRYSPIALLKEGQVTGVAVVHRIPSNRNVYCPVKLSADHGFIRLRKLLI